MRDMGDAWNKPLLMGVRWYLAYPLSYRHVEDLWEDTRVPASTVLPAQRLTEHPSRGPLKSREMMDGARKHEALRKRSEEFGLTLESGKTQLPQPL